MPMKAVAVLIASERRAIAPPDKCARRAEFVQRFLRRVPLSPPNRLLRVRTRVCPALSRVTAPVNRRRHSIHLCLPRSLPASRLLGRHPFPHLHAFPLPSPL